MLSLQQRQQSAQRARQLQEALEIEDTSQLLVTAEGLDQRLARVMPYLPGDRAGKRDIRAHRGHPGVANAKYPACDRQRAMHRHLLAYVMLCLPHCAVQPSWNPAALRFAVASCKMLYRLASLVTDRHQQAARHWSDRPSLA